MGKGKNKKKKKNKDDQLPTHLAGVHLPARDLDEDAREIYVADGYLNKRVMVFDLDTGAF